MAALLSTDCRAVTFAYSGPTFGNHVSLIVGPSPHEQMIRPNAAAIADVPDGIQPVAIMAQHKTVRYWSVEQLPREAMRPCRRCVLALSESAIAGGEQTAGPQPAGIRFVDEGPESLSESAPSSFETARRATESGASCPHVRGIGLERHTAVWTDTFDGPSGTIVLHRGSTSVVSAPGRRKRCGGTDSLYRRKLFQAPTVKEQIAKAESIKAMAEGQSANA